MNQKSDIKISVIAYTKIFLHACKHFGSPIGGFLLGKADEIVDVVPVSHSIPIGPLIEVANDIVDSMYPNEIAIVGYYFANESSAETISPPYINTISDAIKLKTGSCIILQFNDKAITDLSSLCVIVASSWGKAKLIGNISDINAMLNRFLAKGQQNLISDIENHVNSAAEVSCDIRNKFVEKAIEGYSP